MPVWAAISRLLMAFAMVGLFSGAFAAPMKGGAMADTSASMVAVDGMQCCDPPQSSPDCRDMKGCPFATVCAAACPTRVPTYVFVQVRSATSLVMALRDDQLGDTLASSPLGHPPKA